MDLRWVDFLQHMLNTRPAGFPNEAAQIRALVQAVQTCHCHCLDNVVVTAILDGGRELGVHLIDVISLQHMLFSL